MSLQELLRGGGIILQESSRQEIQELLRIAARSLSDATVPGSRTKVVSPWRTMQCCNSEPSR